MPSYTTLKGGAHPLYGTELKKGDMFPNIRVNKDLFNLLSTSEFAGKTVIYSVVPSLDTGVCDMQAKRFNEELGKLGENVIVAVVSRDLPPAMARWCGAITANANLKLLSDFNLREFGKATGTDIFNVGILCRAIFVVGADGVIKHVEYVKEITSHPNYDAAIAAAK